MTPLKRYQKDLEKGFHYDRAQEAGRYEAG